jgi:hypothetical protein
MKRHTTKEKMRAWKARWELVNAAEREELRTTPPIVKLRQLAALMASAESMGWTEALAAEVDEVRERWKKLRQAYGV